MKRFIFFLSLLLVTALVSSCIFIPKELFSPNGSESDVGISGESSEPSDTDISETESGEDTPESVDPYELYAAADRKNEEMTTFVTDFEMKTDVKFTDNTQTYTGNVKQKVSDYGSEDEATFITYTASDDEEGMIFRYKDGVGYYEDGKTMISFDCTYDDLDYFAYIIIFPPDPEQEDVDVFELMKDKLTYEELEKGDRAVKASGLIASNEHKKALLGSLFLMHDTVSEMQIDACAVINEDGYIISLSSRLSFSASIQGVKYFYETENILSVSDINGKVQIVIPAAEYDHIGDYESLYAFDSYYYLESLPAYSAKCVQNIKVENGGFDIDDIITNEANVIIGDEITFSLVSDYNYIADLERYTYYTYFENGTYYEKYLNDVYEEELGKNYFDGATVSLWTLYCLTPDCGYDYVYTDNGDGTATLTFKYTDESIIFLANAYAYNNLTEDYYDAFSDIMYGSSASSSVTYDIETGALIRHTYNIDASFSIDGDIVDYIESNEITVTTENVTVPERNVFLGTSDF